MHTTFSELDRDIHWNLLCQLDIFSFSPSVSYMGAIIQKSSIPK